MLQVYKQQEGTGTKMYHNYSNVGQSLFLKFGALICEVVLSSCMRGQTKLL